MMKATLVLLLARLIIPTLRGRSAAERHVLWATALTVAALLPLLGVLLPSWEPEWAARVSGAWPATFGSSVSPPAEGPDDIVIRATGVEATSWMLRNAASFVWIAGTAAVLLMLAVETIKLRRLLSTAVSAAKTRVDEAACEVARALQLAHMPRVYLSAQASMPIAWGVMRTRVLLPGAACGWPDDRLRAVLAHEMAHLRRGDWPVHILAEVICAAYWFHPLVWIARNHLCRQSECAADDLVLNLGTAGPDYAGHLVDVVRAARPGGRMAPSVAMASVEGARGSHFERRVAALLDVMANRTIVTKTRMIGVAMAASFVVVPLAALGSAAGANIEVRTTGLPPLLQAGGDAALAQGATPPLRHVRMVNTLRPRESWTAPEVTEYTTPPLYSDEARRRGIEGVVTAAAHIDAAGRVTHAHVIKGLGLGLDQNALVALRQWRFQPGTRDGRPAATDVEVDIEFTLRNEAINALVANDMATLVGPGVTPPRAVRTVTLGPAEAGSHRARGTVVLDVVLLENGTPRIVRILRSVTPEADERAIRTFEQWRFSPALEGGRPVKVRMHAEVRVNG